MKIVLTRPHDNRSHIITPPRIGLSLILFGERGY
jgi:hypothetical protein